MKRQKIAAKTPKHEDKISSLCLRGGKIFSSSDRSHRNRKWRDCKSLFGLTICSVCNAFLLNDNRLKQFVDLLDVEVITVNADVARKYAIIYLSLQKSGTKIPINDVWIAASCMAVGGTLLTRDKHFNHVER